MIHQMMITNYTNNNKTTCDICAQRAKERRGKEQKLDIGTKPSLCIVRIPR
jgi:hypothetical protein